MSRTGRLAAANFDVFITVDKNLPYQQSLATLPLAVVVLAAQSNELPALLPLAPKLMASLPNVQPRTYSHIEA